MLDQIIIPADLRRVAEGDLPQVAQEVRAEMIDAVSKTGGHLGAGLGVVELGGGDAVLEALDQVQLPQRAVVVESASDRGEDADEVGLGHAAAPHVPRGDFG